MTIILWLLVCSHETPTLFLVQAGPKTQQDNSRADRSPASPALESILIFASQVKEKRRGELRWNTSCLHRVSPGKAFPKSVYVVIDLGIRRLYLFVPRYLFISVRPRSPSGKSLSPLDSISPTATMVGRTRTCVGDEATGMLVASCFQGIAVMA
ncbi:hypothetical protein PG985_014308 [Apiospora marii]|uniref:uncharacterized protein n=1 Tax=Apiospora marii TaxID=335849 RepID=UPI00312E1BF0